MRRVTAAVSVLLLLLVSVAVAEASLLALVILFSSILELRLVVELGGRFVQVAPAAYLPFPDVSIREAGTAGSFVFTLACGLAAGARRYRRWRPAP